MPGPVLRDLQFAAPRTRPGSFGIKGLPPVRQDGKRDDAARPSRRLDQSVDIARIPNAQDQDQSGGGAALTREKIVAAVARTFICIADASKLVPVLGAFPLPVEVIPMARSHVARQLVKLGGDPVYREGVLTDNGNIILDVHNMSIVDPVKLEAEINAIVGVVTNGLFAARPADLLLLGTAEGVKALKR